MNYLSIDNLDYRLINEPILVQSNPISDSIIMNIIE